MTQTTVAIRTADPIGTISPRLYGHFAEHLARCCYDGLWVGAEEREIAHTGGFRTDVLDALRQLPVPLLPVRASGARPRTTRSDSTASTWGRRRCRSSSTWATACPTDHPVSARPPRARRTASPSR